MSFKGYRYWLQEDFRTHQLNTSGVIHIGSVLIH